MLFARAFLSRLPALVADVALAVTIAAVSSVMDGVEPHGHALGALLLWDLALAAPLAARRHARGLAAATIAVVCLAQWIADVPTHGDLFVPVMLYTLGRYERRRMVLLAAAGVTELGILLAVARWSSGTDAWLTALTYTGTAAASWLLGVYIRTRRVYLASMIDRAKTAERARISREMHDIITHSLSVMVTLNDAAAAVSDTRAARQAISQSAEVGRQALAEMHRLLSVLRQDSPPEMTPQPGLAEVPDLLAMVRAAGLSATLSITGELDNLPGTVELTIYRLVQESLTNVLKHARNVTTVTVSITGDADRVTVLVDNDGDQVATPRYARGHGLAGMRERLNLYDGHLHAGPGHREGWQVVAHFTIGDVIAAASSTAAVAADATSLRRQT